MSSFWHQDVTSKVVLFAWRLFHDRLPTKDNLSRRRVIDIDDQSCVGGCCWNKGCFTSHLLSFDNNKVLKIINWIC